MWVTLGLLSFPARGNWYSLDEKWWTLLSVPCLVFFLGGGAKLNQSTRNQEVLLFKSLRAITDTVIEDIPLSLYIYFSDLCPQCTEQGGAWTTHPSGMEEISRVACLQSIKSPLFFIRLQSFFWQLRFRLVTQTTSGRDLRDVIFQASLAKVLPNKCL